MMYKKFMTFVTKTFSSAVLRQLQVAVLATAVSILAPFSAYASQSIPYLDQSRDASIKQQTSSPQITPSFRRNPCIKRGINFQFPSILIPPSQSSFPILRSMVK